LTVLLGDSIGLKLRRAMAGPRFRARRNRLCLGMLQVYAVLSEKGYYEIRRVFREAEV
jgi:hypothetical protein